MKTLAERLEWARKQKGLSQQQLADQVGVAQSTIGSLEAGTRLTARKITAIASTLGVSGAWLAEGAGPREPGGAPVTEMDRSQKKLQWVDDFEAEMLSLFRACGQAEKDTSLVVLKSLPKAIADDLFDQG